MTGIWLASAAMAVAAGTLAAIFERRARGDQAHPIELAGTVAAVGLLLLATGMVIFG